MLLSTSNNARPRDCKRWPRDTERSSTFLVVLKPSCNSRWCKPAPMRGLLRQMPTPSMVSSQRSQRGILVSISFILNPIHTRTHCSYIIVRKWWFRWWFNRPDEKYHAEPASPFEHHPRADRHGSSILACSNAQWNSPSKVSDHQVKRCL